MSSDRIELLTELPTATDTMPSLGCENCKAAATDPAYGLYGVCWNAILSDRNHCIQSCQFGIAAGTAGAGREESKCED